MPELFEMPYLLPAIIVVVLLVALVLAVYAGRRKRAAMPPTEMTRVEREMAPSASDPTARVASPYPPLESSGPEAPMDDEPPVAPDYVAGEASGDAASADTPNGQPPVGASQGQPVRTWQQVAPPDRGSNADPITPVLVELLHGWGEFSDADVKRLSIFRPEKVQAAVQTLELPKDLKNDRDAGARLEQLTLYASQLQAKTPGAESPTDEAQAQPDSEADDGAEAVDAETAGGEAEAAPAVAMAVADADRGVGGTGAVAGAAALAAAVSAADAESERDSEPPALAGTPETPLATLPWALEADQWEQAKVEPDAGEFKPYEEWPLAVSTQVGGGELGSEAWGAPPAPGTPEDFDAMEAGALAAFAAGSVAADDHDHLDDTLETAPRPAPLLGGIVKTADELMALPPGERAEMVAFLQPSELAGVLKRTDDPELKRAIIDTLENVSTPASLDVLRECLEDRDPEIQAYALQAADRILGH